MLRSILTQGLRSTRQLLAVASKVGQQNVVCPPQKFNLNFAFISSSQYSTNLCGNLRNHIIPCGQPLGLLNRIPSSVMVDQKRTQMIKYNMRNGRRKTDYTVTRRFFRLNWGMWIRTMSGRSKKLWKKRGRTKKNLRHHVMCNASQCHLLDRMVTKYWRRERFLVDDPYAPYHKRENYWRSKRAPLPFPGFY